jgi:hypothetical protein
MRKTDLENTIELIVNKYYDLDMSEENCIDAFLDDLYDNYDYDTLQLFIDNKLKSEVKNETINTKQ